MLVWHKTPDVAAEHGLLSPHERILEKICEQIWDVQLPQVVEQVLGGPRIPSRDRILQGTAERILNVPVPEMVEQLVKLPETTSEDGIQQRTVERIADIPVPQVAEELVEVSKVFPKDRLQQRFVEQSIDTHGISLAEKIVEGPVSQTQGKTQQFVNTSVHYVIEVETHIIQGKINQVTRHVETTLLQFIDKAVNIHVVAQRQVRMNWKVHKTIEIPQLQHTDQVVDVPVVLVAQVPHVRVVMKTVETPQLQSVVQAPRCRSWRRQPSYCRTCKFHRCAS